MEEPCQANGFVWVVTATVDGCVGIGRHAKKRSAIMLAENNARCGVSPDIQAIPPSQPTVETEPTQKPGVSVVASLLLNALEADVYSADRRIYSSQHHPERVRKILSNLSDDRGQRSEKRVFKVFHGRTKEAPSWFRGLKHPTLEQDRLEQIDAIVLTNDVGEIYLQIKSSNWGLVKFLSHRPPNVDCIVILVTMTDQQVRDLVIRTAARRRQKLLDEAAANLKRLERKLAAVKPRKPRSIVINAPPFPKHQPKKPKPLT
ncbi:hypothetical protein HZC53_05155 [Candidatus Uhrbacteria bacterium]|nr:hypothetical protein [Candidatus Uhrbacteria bacterium]